MGKKAHVELFQQGAGPWNVWRRAHPEVQPSLSEIRVFPLGREALNLDQIDLSGANLRGADLVCPTFRGAKFSEAQFRSANLNKVHFYGCDLRACSFFDSHLLCCEFRDCDLSDADFTRAGIRRSAFTNCNVRGMRLWETDLSFVRFDRTDLSLVSHGGPSAIDTDTLFLNSLPFVFLRGVGLSDKLIDYLPSLAGNSIEYYSCFISYSIKDQAFADRLHADLQARGVRCWFAPHDLPIGAKTWDQIDEAIRRRDRVLLILSSNSIASEWVEDEVSKAFAEERKRERIVLFPIRIDDAVMQTGEPWAVKLRDQRNIGDFRSWEVSAAYSEALSRILRDLRANDGLRQSS